MVFHDENVRRVTDGDKAVKEHALEEIKQVKISAGKDSNGENTYTTVPTVDDGSYLWSMTTVTYSDGTEVIYPLSFVN